ncbi:MAG TPA: HEAT repeat domain-containing protein [Solirubrobacteraceae bacterium]
MNGRRDTRARRSAVIQLAIRPSPDARDVLIAALRDSDKKVRIYALGGLLQVGAAGVPLEGAPIERALRDGLGLQEAGGSDVIYEEVRSMFEEGGPWLNLGFADVLIDVLATSPDAARRAGAAYKLARIPTADALRGLLGAVQDPSPSVRLATAKALAPHASRSPVVRRALESLAEDRDRGVRKVVTDVLGTVPQDS